jgi:DnaJ-class molecular chaperone
MITEPNPLDCQECRGSGSITIRHRSGDQQLERDADCPECNGTGDAVTPINQSDEE